MSSLEDCGTQKNEKQRRERLGMKFELLKSLIPNPTKPDRATIISDTINYIKELSRTLNELKLRAGKKEGQKYFRTIKIEEGEVHRDMESPSIKSIVDEESDHGQIHGNTNKCSWIQRRFPSTFVDVRTIEDEVYIKLQQIKRMDCPLIVSRVLDELQLEMIHFSGGSVGNCTIFMISSKRTRAQWLGGSSKPWMVRSTVPLIIYADLGL
ncbi:Transcription factor bHLH89 [Platanthera guangdongensis]|uniref:Transcription factor bHLH89 n=1 Tax=Platanthera guangdongensis TaxID=2320717 RepID=A0ABR2MAE0_9ASPA